MIIEAYPTYSENYHFANLDCFSVKEFSANVFLSIHGMNMSGTGSADDNFNVDTYICKVLTVDVIDMTTYI